MAVVTVVAARNVRRVLAGGGHAVVAGATSAQNLGVIDRYYGCEHSSRVAVFTNIGCQRVRGILARGIGAVMAVNAATGDRRMIEAGR